MAVSDALLALTEPTDVVAGDDADDFDPRAEAKRREPWRFPKPPSVARVQQEAESLKADHAYRILVASIMNQWLNGERQGHFPKDAPLLKNGEMTYVRIKKLMDEHRKMVNWHASKDVHIKAFARDVIDREEREATEDYCRLLWEEWQDDFSQMDGNGSLRMAIPDTLGRTGMLAAYIAPDPHNESTGVCFQMIDPFSVYPVWEGKRGLARVYVIYLADADHVIGHYVGNDEKLEATVRRLAAEDTGGEEYETPTEKELIVCYDRANCTVLWGGELIKQTQHDQGKVPFVIQYSGLGMQGFMNSPTPLTTPTDTDLLIMGPEYWSANSRQLDLARKMTPLLWHQVQAHALEEAIAVRLVSDFRRKSYKPPVVVRQGPMSASEGEPETDPQEDGKTLLRADDAIEQYPALVEPQLMTAMLTMVGQNSQSGHSSVVLNGSNLGGAQASGNAVDLLKADGTEDWLPVTIGKQEFLQKCFREALEIVRDNGEYLGDPEEPAGIAVPRMRRDMLMGLTDPHVLTPDILARPGGCRVSVTLRKFNAASLPPLIQSLGMAKQAGLMSQELAIELIAAATDIEGEIRRIERDQFDQVPEMMTARHLRMAHTMALNALRLGDVESARQELLSAKFLADQQTIGMMQRISMVSGSTMEAMQATAMMQQTGAMTGMDPAMLTQMGQGGQQMPMQGNAAPYLSPSQFGGTTGQQSPGRPQTGQQGQQGQQGY